MSRFAPLLLVLGVAVAWATCVTSDNIGDPCTSSSSCSSNRVCEPIDPKNATGEAACLPMARVDAPVSCDVDDDCIKAGFPVDGKCIDAADSKTSCTTAKCCSCALANIVCDEPTVVDFGHCECVGGDESDAGPGDAGT